MIQYIYYLEVNSIAITIGAVLLFLSKRTTSKNETSQLILNNMLILLEVACVCDILAYCFRGKNYSLLQITNILYFLAFDLGAFAWFLFILVKMGYVKNLRKAMLYTGSPVFLLAAAIVLNPLTNYFFTLDEQLIYHRGPGILLTWVVEWGYIFIALGLNVRSVIVEKRHFRKQEYRGYLHFAIPMVVSAACQMMFYGITSTQIGFMLALLLAFLNNQFYQVQRDNLTGLNNRNSLLNYQDSLFTRSGEYPLTVFMLDMNDFKAINDTYGHVLGDRALRDTADALKAAVGKMPTNRLTLFRYGGDEFIIIGKNISEEQIQTTHDAIEENIQLKNEQNHAEGRWYRLSVSIGVASQICKESSNFDTLLKQADRAMYHAKAASKHSQGSSAVNRE